MIPPALPTVNVGSPTSITTAHQINAFEHVAQRVTAGLPGSPSPEGGGLTSLSPRLEGGLQGWQASIHQMDQMIESSSSSASPAPLAAPVMGRPLDGTRPIFRLLVETFNFAMQTQLVARAATQFTGSISTLMKGQ